MNFSNVAIIFTGRTCIIITPFIKLFRFFSLWGVVMIIKINLHEITKVFFVVIFCHSVPRGGDNKKKQELYW